MRFKINRTSESLWREKQPCPEAIKKGRNWYIEIDNLADLIKFVKKHGQIIIIKNRIMEIEIYDDWRE